jgi:hypothetical protein
MRGAFKTGIGLFWLCAMLLFASTADAQLNSNRAGINLQAVVNPSLAVAVSPATVNFFGQPNTVVNGDSPVTIRTAWNLPFGFSGFIANVSTWAYFSAPGVALTNGVGNNIPANRVQGSVNGGAFAPFNTVGPFSTASRQIFSQNVLALGGLTQAARTDTLTLRIDTVGLGLPPGVYAGVLLIRARAI